MNLRSDRSYWPVLVLLFFTVCFFWPAIFENEIFYYRDLFYFHYPLRHYWASVIHSNEIPYLNTALNAGQPILANPNYATFYPLTWLYVLLPFDIAWNFILAGHVLWGALGMYWLARLHKCERVPSLCASVIFAFSGTFLSCLNQSNMAIAGSWLPWIVGATIQAFYLGGRWVFVAVLAFALQFLSGEPTVSLVTGTLIASGWILGVVKSKSKKTLVVRAGWIIGVTALLISIQLIPTLLWLPHSARGMGLDVRQSALYWSLHPARLIELIVPNYYGNVMSPLLAEYWGGRLSDTGYPYILRFYCGWIPLLVAPFAWKRQHGKAALILAIAGLAFALGRWLPGFETVYGAIPLLQFVRYPEKFLLFFSFGIALASALGLSQWMQTPQLRLLSVAMIVLILPAVIFTLWPFPENLNAGQRSQQIQSILFALLYALAAMCILLLRTRLNLKPFFQIGLLFFVILNLVPYTIDIAETRPLKVVHEPNPVIAAFPHILQTNILHLGEEQTQIIFEGGIDPEILLRESLYPYSGLSLGVRYGATSDIDRMGGRSSWMRQLIIRKKFPSIEALHLMRRAGISSLLTFKPESSKQLVLRGKALMDGGKGTVFLYDLNPAAESEVRWEQGNGEIHWTERARNNLFIQVETSQSGKLLITRNALPGWICKLDQQLIQCFESPDGFLTIDVPAGRHTLDLTYISPGFKMGAAVSFIGIVFLVAKLVIPKTARTNKETTQPRITETGR